eukprot:1714239-Prymnesium_polylepis.2
MEILAHYLPWLGGAYNCSTAASSANRGRVPSSAVAFSRAVAALALRRNALDERVFAFGEQLFEEQLRLARTAAWRHAHMHAPHANASRSRNRHRLR